MNSNTTKARFRQYYPLMGTPMDRLRSHNKRCSTTPDQAIQLAVIQIIHEDHYECQIEQIISTQQPDGGAHIVTL